MATTFRSRLLAATIVAGFALCAVGSASAGPNSPNISPSMGNFSSARPDFNVRAPDARRNVDQSGSRGNIVAPNVDNSRDAARMKTKNKNATPQEVQRRWQSQDFELQPRGADKN